MGRIRVTKQDQRANRGRVRATNRELMQIAAGINHIVIKHDSQWSLMPGMGPTDKIFDCEFTYPILRRPITENDKMVAIEWAKMHPRYWRVILTLDMHDGEKWYADQVQIDTPEPYKLNDLKAHVDENWKVLEEKANPKHIRGRRWTARIIKTHELKELQEEESAA